MIKLEHRLLKIGGAEVESKDDRVFNKFLIINYATLLKTQELKLPVIYHWMRPHKCHDNSNLYAAQHPHSIIYSGYALSTIDNCWLYHSWSVEDNHIVELTYPMAKYYGIPRTSVITDSISVGSEESRDNN